MLIKTLRRFFTSKPSHLMGDFSSPLSENSVSKQFSLSSQTFKDNLAVISDYQQLQLTFSELFNLSRRAAANMIDLGLKPGTKVGVYSPNNIEWVLIQYACSLADLHMVNINPAYKPKELIHGLSLTEVESLIVSDNKVPARIMNNVDIFMQQDNVSLAVNQESGILMFYLLFLVFNLLFSSFFILFYIL